MAQIANAITRLLEVQLHAIHCGVKVGGDLFNSLYVDWVVAEWRRDDDLGGQGFRGDDAVLLGCVVAITLNDFIFTSTPGWTLVCQDPCAIFAIS